MIDVNAFPCEVMVTGKNYDPLCRGLHSSAPGSAEIHASVAGTRATVVISSLAVGTRNIT